MSQIQSQWIVTLLNDQILIIWMKLKIGIILSNIILKDHLGVDNSRNLV